MAVRIPQSLRSSVLQAQLGAGRVALWKAEQQAVTGKIASKPSDAADLWTRAERVRAAREDQTVYQANAEHAANLLSVADDALGGAANAVKRAYELAVAMASEIPDGLTRASVADEVDALRGTVIERANTKYGGRYLFAGTGYDAPAFDATGTYQGTSDPAATRTGDDTFLQIGFDGGAMFQGAIDVPQLLGDLSTAIRSGDHLQVKATLDTLSGAIAQIGDARTQVGSLQVRAEDAMVTSENLHLQLEGQLADLIGIDPVEAYTKIAELRTSYEASLTIASQSLGRSLFDYLR